MLKKRKSWQRQKVKCRLREPVTLIAAVKNNHVQSVKFPVKAAPNPAASPASDAIA